MGPPLPGPLQFYVKTICYFSLIRKSKIIIYLLGYKSYSASTIYWKIQPRWRYSDFVSQGLSRRQYFLGRRPFCVKAFFSHEEKLFYVVEMYNYSFRLHKSPEVSSDVITLEAKM